VSIWYLVSDDIPLSGLDARYDAIGLAAKAVPRWAPATAYTIGQQVVSPNNDVVSANVGHTSSAAYATDVAKWAVSSTYGTLLTPVETIAYNGDGTVASQTSAGLRRPTPTTATEPWRPRPEPG
jgi:hypothetical protein